MGLTVPPTHDANVRRDRRENLIGPSPLAPIIGVQVFNRLSTRDQANALSLYGTLDIQMSVAIEKA